MPSKSRNQQQLFGMALAYKRGELSSSEVSDDVKRIADSMSGKDIKKFAKTKHKGLPDKVKEEYTTDSPALIERLIEYCNKKQDRLDEAEYKGREVSLNKPMRGDVKKYKVYVKNPDSGDVVKVNFGDKNMEIRRDDPQARKNFRSRHKCDQKKDKTTAGYWSCKFWSKTPVSKLV